MNILILSAGRRVSLFYSFKKELKKYFPESFEKANDELKKEAPQPVQTVASASRSQQGRRTVKLTKSQVAIAKRLNVPLEEYARYVKEDK